MSIYIKGMELPKDCRECPFFEYNAEADFMCTIMRDVADCCPLVELPEHGRLIDADEIRKSIRESVEECVKWADEVKEGEMYARVSQSIGTFVECSLRIKNAPTIIPAEGGEV